MSNNIAELKKVADDFLRKYETEHIMRETTPDEQNLIEAMRIYQHELEIQYQELQNSQYNVQLAEEKYRALFLSIPLAFVVLDSNGMVTDCNQAAMDFFRCRNKTYLLRRNVYRLVDKQSATLISQYLGIHEPTEEFKKFTGHAFGDDIEWRHVNFTFGALTEKTHDSSYAILMIEDIDNATEESKWQSEQAYQQNPQLMFSLSVKGNLSTFNLAAKALFKNMLVPNLNKQFIEVFEDDIAQEIQDLMKKVLHSHHPVETNFNHQLGNTNYNYHISAYPIFTEDKVFTSVGFIFKHD